MDQDNNSNDIAKLKCKMKDMERITREQGETTLAYTTGDVKRLIASGHMPKELGEWHIQQAEEQNRTRLEWKQSLKDDPDMPEVDRKNFIMGLYKVPSPEEYYANIVRYVEMHDLLQKLKDEGVLEQAEEYTELEPLFKTLKPDEFGISRLIADPLANSYKLLPKGNPILLNGKLYVSVAECKNSKGDTIRLEQRYEADSQEEANKKAEERMGRITGPQRKVHGVAWALANKKRSRLIDCELTDLMIIANPGRPKESFSSTEKSTFYEHFFGLSKANIIVIKEGETESEFHMPFITIFKTSRHNPASDKISDRYPNSLSFSVLYNPLYAKEALYHVGAGIKQKIFELRPEDAAFAEWISVRKNQKRTATSITFYERDELMKLAGLEGIKRRATQNDRLLKKLKRIRKTGTIISYPSRVTFPFTIKTKETHLPRKKY